MGSRRKKFNDVLFETKKLKVAWKEKRMLFTPFGYAFEKTKEKGQ